MSWGSPVFYFYLFSMCRVAKEMEISYSRVNGGGGIWWKMTFEKAAESLGAPCPYTPRRGRDRRWERRRSVALGSARCPSPTSSESAPAPTKPSLPRPSPLRSCTVSPPPCAVPAALFGRGRQCWTLKVLKLRWEKPRAQNLSISISLSLPDTLQVRHMLSSAKCPLSRVI